VDALAGPSLIGILQIIGLVLLGKSSPETHGFLPSNIGKIYRKPMVFKGKSTGKIVGKFSHHPIL